MTHVRDAKRAQQFRFDKILVLNIKRVKNFLLKRYNSISVFSPWIFFMNTKKSAKFYISPLAVILRIKQTLAEGI